MLVYYEVYKQIRPPWNMYEYSACVTVDGIHVYQYIIFRRDLQFLWNKFSEWIKNTQNIRHNNPIRAKKFDEPITVTTHGRLGFSFHRPLVCLCKSLFRLTTSKSTGNQQRIPHQKWSVMHPCHDVIMRNQHYMRGVVPGAGIKYNNNTDTVGCNY